MTSRARTVFFAALVALTCGLGVLHAQRHGAPQWAFAVDADNPRWRDGAPSFQTVERYEPPAGQAHSPAIRINDDGFDVLWFEGTQEAATDVAIMSASYTHQGNRWRRDSQTTLFDAPAISGVVAPHQSIAVLGNTIAAPVADDEARYLATIVGIGGWSMASVADVRMRNGVPESARRIDLSPVFGRSQLVRAPIVAFADGDIALPAYFEMGTAFSELIRLDPAGRVTAKRRIDPARRAIQPAIVPVDKTNAVALMRNFGDGDQLLASWTDDGGRSWSPVVDLDLPNPDAPVAALRLSDGRVLLAFNDASEHANSLALAVSEDLGRTWQTIAAIEQHGPGPGMAARYPALARLHNGEIALTYSFGSKTGIAVHVFNEVWLDTR